MPQHHTPSARSPQQVASKPKEPVRYYVGIDVGATHLDVHIRPEKILSGGLAERFENTPQGRKRVARRLKHLTIASVTCEATGKLERPIVRSLAAQGYVVHVLNPAQLVGFRKARGKVAKTDALDAELLSLFAEVMRPEARPLPDDSVLELRDLVVRRRQLVAARTAEQNRTYRTEAGLAARQMLVHIRLLERQIEALDSALKACVEACPVFQKKFALLISIPGVGPVAALTLLAEMPELGTLHDKAIAALCGLAPMNSDSGKRSGHARLRGRRKAVRAALYMAAMSARRYNDTIRAFYERLITHGKAKLVALCAAMRKLLIIANHILASGLPWKPLAA